MKFSQKQEENSELEELNIRLKSFTQPIKQSTVFTTSKLDPIPIVSKEIIHTDRLSFQKEKLFICWAKNPNK